MYTEPYEIQCAAAALYDGGWRSTDRAELRRVYELTKEEARNICEELAKLEGAALYAALVADDE